MESNKGSKNQASFKRHDKKSATAKELHTQEEMTLISTRELHELRSAKERLELGISTSEVGVWEWDAVHDVQYWDDAMYRLYGVQKNDFVRTYQGWIDIIHPEDQAKADEAIQKSLRNECEYHVEFRVVWPDRSIHYIKATSTSQRDEKGTVLRMFGVNTDVTEQRRSEIDLKRQNDLLASLLKVLPVAVQTIDAQTGQTVVYNDAALKYLGRAILPDHIPIENLGEEYNACIYGTHTPYPPERMPIVRALHGESSTIDDLELVRPNGNNTLLEIHGAPVYNEEGEIWASTVAFMDITKRKKVEEELQASNERFRDIFRLTPLACSITDIATGQLIDINNSCSAVIGYTREEMVGHTTVELGIWASVESRNQFIANLKRDTFVNQQEIQLRKKSGEIADFLISAEIITLSGTECMLSTFLDITDRKHAEMELLKKTSLMLEMERLGKVGGWEIDIATGKQVWTNETYVIHEVDSSFEPTVENGIHFYTPESLPIISEAVEQAIQCGTPFDKELDIITAKGNQRFVHAIGNVDLENGRVFGFFQDITERKEVEAELLKYRSHLEQLVVERTEALNHEIEERIALEEALRSSEERLQLILKGANDAAWDWDLAKDQLYYAPRWWEMLGYKPDELPSDSALWKRTMHPEDGSHVEAVFGSALASEEDFYEVEFRLLHKDGHYVPVMSRGYILRDNFGKPIRVSGTNTDLTRQKEFEASLIQAREVAEAANQAKSIFLANMSHELRTPLNAIIGFAQILEHDPSVGPLQRENVKIILKSGEHLLDIINDVLDLSKIEAGKVTLEPQEFDLGALTYELITMLRTRAESKGLKLILDQSSSFPRFVKTDPSKLRQILINLIGNAIKYTTHGEVSLKLSTIALNHGTDRIELSFEITDTGKGISSKDLERIFHPFEQISQNNYTEGTGLGLAITYEYVRLLGGNISVTSKPGVGSTFHFTICGELVRADSMETIVKHSREIRAIEEAEKYKILIVEDNLENRLLIHQLLKPFGFQLREAENGRIGVAITGEWGPDMVLMDRRMPEMDGLEATRQIRALTSVSKQPIIVAVTAHAYKEERQEMLDAGCDAFLRKPFETQELFKLIGDLLPVKISYTSSDDSTVQGESSLSLPAEVVQRLITACEACSPGEVQLLLEPYPEALAVLRPLLDGFRFHEILQFLCKEEE